jgi:multisubunit Na+/H+ antiporter MnhF subunit
MMVAPDAALELALNVSYALLVFGIACAFTRLVRGPSLPDRVVALDYTAILTVGFAALYARGPDEADLWNGISLFRAVAISRSRSFLSTAAPLVSTGPLRAV